MSVIIRLQNLPWSANASDVRGFFRGLGIPDGGVHIVGGENGDAFIAFSTDEDARQAMMLNGTKLKETQVHLLLSSRAEMQKVIETARQQTMSFMNFSAQQPTVTVTPSLPVIAPQISIPAIQTQPSILNGANSVVGLMDPLATAKPQPPVITSSSLSGILAQQMLQQHQIQLIRQQQNMPVLTSTSVRHDSYKSMNQYNSMGHQYGDNSDSGKNLQGNDSKRNRNSRSRSRSRDRRDRRRSRSRERSRRYRDRSRSRERRRRSRRSPSSDRRSRSRDRERNSRDSGRKGRSYDKDVRTSLDRNKIVDESNSNFNSAIENNVNAPTNAVDQHKPFNYSDGGASNNNFNNGPNDGSNVAFNNFNTQSRNDFPTKSMNDFDPTMALVPMRDTNNSMNIGSCIRITNLNNRTHYAAIRKFFYGLQIPNDGIKLLNDENGKRTNDVVVRFARPDIARDAQALDGKILNGNTVRITTISDAEYENEVDSFQPPRRNASRFGNRYDDRNYSGDRGGSEENNRDGGGSNRRNNRNDYYDRGFQRNRFNDDSDGHGNNSRDRHGDDDDVMLISDSNDGETMPVGLTLLIEDLPPFAKEQDIIKMFSDFTLMDIMLAKVNKAFLAYVKFHNQNDAEAALKQTHLHRIDFKSVFVSPCSEETYEKAKQEYDGIGDLNHKPENNTADEPTNFSRDNSHQNSPEGDNEVDQFGRSIRNRKFVQQQQQQTQPPASDNKSQIPSLFNLTFDPPFIANQQPVPADPRLRRQFDQNNSQSPDSQLSPNQQPKAFNPFNQQGRIDPRLQRNSSLPLPNLTNSTNTKVVFIGNVEYNTTEGDIVGFFADIAPPPEGIFFVKNARGQPCGDCYVKFRSADDATRALIKNRFRFRSRVIRVTLAEPDEAAKVLGFSLSEDGDEKNAMSENANEIGSKGNATDEVASEQNDKNDNEPDMDGSNSCSQNAERDGDDDQNGDGNNGEGNQFSREDPRMMYSAPYARGGNIGDRAGNMMNMGNNYFRGSQRSGGGGPDSRGMRGNFNRNNNSNSNSNTNSNNNNSSNNNQRNLEGCIVGLSNVPFAATPRDIADFFGEYNLTPNDIIRRYNDDGSLTGEARVRFLTPMDASKAIDRHQRDRIGNRVIHLRLVT